MMDWEKLLSEKRLGATEVEDETVGRSPFQRDFDRIEFSSSFRRLQDKTQVVPFAENDYVRTRLTHSLEASSVGRSLGTYVASNLFTGDEREREIKKAQFSSIVATASLAHDLGNPPFGHSGEDAIKHFFNNTKSGEKLLAGFSPQQQQDFLQYDGNAQGFRILTYSQAQRRGLQLTYATLGAFTKYPKESFVLNADAIRRGEKSEKYGFFQDDKETFRQVAEAVGLRLLTSEGYWWARHPLAFLVEAADDICYLINDLEDGYRMKQVNKEQVKSKLEPIVPSDIKKADSMSDDDSISFLRARAINSLVRKTGDRFLKHSAGILEGTFHEELIGDIEGVQEIRKFSKEEIYCARPIVEVEIGGFEVVEGLLGAFISAAADVTDQKWDKAKAQSKKLVDLLPVPFLRGKRLPDEDPYKRVLQVVDFVSGMTDSYAVSLYKKIKGISLPSF